MDRQIDIRRGKYEGRREKLKVIGSYHPCFRPDQLTHCFLTLPHQPCHSASSFFLPHPMLQFFCHPFSSHSESWKYLSCFFSPHTKTHTTQSTPQPNTHHTTNTIHYTPHITHQRPHQNTHTTSQHITQSTPQLNTHHSTPHSSLRLRYEGPGREVGYLVTAKGDSGQDGQISERDRQLPQPIVV